MKLYWLGVIFGVGTLGGVIATQSLQSLDSKAENVPEPVIFEAETVPNVSALGRLEPKGRVINLAAPSTVATAARVQELRVQEGDFVQQNQVIAVLDSYNERQAQLIEAETHVSNAQARLRQIQAGAKQGEIDAQVALISQLQAQRDGDLNAQDDQIIRLQAEYDNALAEHDRYHQLFEEGAISTSDLDTRYTVMVSAQKQLNEAKDIRTRLAETGGDRIREAQATLDRIAEVRPIDVSVIQTEVESAIAARTRAEAALAQTLIHAPMDGQILRIHAQEGEVISTDGIATLGQTDAMYAIAEIYEADIGKVEVGQTARVTSEYGGFTGTLEGIVEQIGLEILSNSLYDPDPTSRSEARIVEVQVRLDEDDSDRVSHLTNLQVRIQLY